MLCAACLNGIPVWKWYCKLVDVDSGDQLRVCFCPCYSPWRRLSRRQRWGTTTCFLLTIVRVDLILLRRVKVIRLGLRTRKETLISFTNYLPPKVNALFCVLYVHMISPTTSDVSWMNHFILAPQECVQIKLFIVVRNIIILVGYGC